MNLNILLATSEFRGDHAADVRRAIQFVPGETIEQFIARSGLIEHGDHIEIRLIIPIPTEPAKE